MTRVLRGVERGRFVALVKRTPCLEANVSLTTDSVDISVEVEGLAMAVRESVKQMIALSPEIPDKAASVLELAGRRGPAQST